MFDKLIDSGDLKSVDTRMVPPTRKGEILGYGDVEETTLTFPSGATLVLRPKVINGSWSKLILEEVTGNE